MHANIEVRHVDTFHYALAWRNATALNSCIPATNSLGNITRTSFVCPKRRATITFDHATSVSCTTDRVCLCVTTMTTIPETQSSSYSNVDADPSTSIPIVSDPTTATVDPDNDNPIVSNPTLLSDLPHALSESSPPSTNQQSPPVHTAHASVTPNSAPSNIDLNENPSPPVDAVPDPTACDDGVSPVPDPLANPRSSEGSHLASSSADVGTSVAADRPLSACDGQPVALSSEVQTNIHDSASEGPIVMEDDVPEENDDTVENTTAHVSHRVTQEDATVDATVAGEDVPIAEKAGTAKKADVVSVVVSPEQPPQPDKEHLVAEEDTTTAPTVANDVTVINASDVADIMATVSTTGAVIVDPMATQPVVADPTGTTAATYAAAHAVAAAARIVAATAGEKAPTKIRFPGVSTPSCSPASVPVKNPVDTVAATAAAAAAATAATAATAAAAAATSSPVPSKSTQSRRAQTIFPASSASLIRSPAALAAAAAAAAAAGVSPEAVAAVMAATAAAAAAQNPSNGRSQFVGKDGQVVENGKKKAPASDDVSEDGRGAENDGLAVGKEDVVMTDALEIMEGNAPPTTPSTPGGGPDTPSRSCIALNLNQKHVVYEEYKRRRAAKEPIDQQGLAVWAMQRFGLSTRPSQSTISRILKTIGSTSKHTVVRGVSKRNRLTGNPQLEQALHAWINAQFAERRSVNGALIVDAARRIQDRMNAALPPEKRVNMKFSNGWLQKFKQRCTLSSFKCSGDGIPSSSSLDGFHAASGSAGGVGDVENLAMSAATDPPMEVAIVNATMVSIKDTLNALAKKDVWCATEFGHCYKMSPETASVVDGDSTTSPGDGTTHPSSTSSSASATLADRERITYLACTNADGSERVPLLIVGRTAKPKMMMHKLRNSGIADELDFDYHFSQDALMTSTIFFEWLIRFDRYIERSSKAEPATTTPVDMSAETPTENLKTVTPNTRRVALLLESCTIHGTLETLPHLTHVKVYFLPALRKPKTFPLENVIHLMKAQYRRRQYEMALDNIDAGRGSIYHLDLLTAMRVMTDVWESLPASVVMRAWHESELVGHISQPAWSAPETEGITLENELESIKQLVVALVPPVTLGRVSLNNLVRPIAEQTFLQSANEEELASSAAAAVIAKDAMDLEEQEEEPCCLMDGPVCDKLRSLVVVKHLLLRNNVSQTPELMALERLQRHLRAIRDRETPSSTTNKAKLKVLAM